MVFYNIWVTKNCNMDCVYCYEGHNKKSDYLNEKTAKQIINFIQQTADTNENEIIVNFHGGEPLLNFKIIKYFVNSLKNIFNKKIIFGITTNGTIFSNEIIEFLCDNFNYSLTISIDGNKEVHNRFRKMKTGGDSYDIAINTAKKCLVHRDNIRIRMTVNAEMVPDLFGGVIHLLNEGFKIIVPAIDFFDNNWNQETVNILENQLFLIKDYLNNEQNGYQDIRIKLLETEKRDSIGICSGGITSCHVETTVLLVRKA